MYSVPTCALVRARTHCDILKLSKTDVQQVLQHFPESEWMDVHLNQADKAILACNHVVAFEKMQLYCV